MQNKSASTKLNRDTLIIDNKEFKVNSAGVVYQSRTLPHPPAPAGWRHGRTPATHHFAQGAHQNPVTARNTMGQASNDQTYWRTAPPTTVSQQQQPMNAPINPVAQSFRPNEDRSSPPLTDNVAPPPVNQQQPYVNNQINPMTNRQTEDRSGSHHDLNARPYTGPITYP